VWSVTVKSWIPSTIHCIRLFLFSRNSKDCRTEVNLPGTRAKLVLFFANTSFTLLVGRASEGVINKWGSVFPGHHSPLAELQIIVRFDPGFIAFVMFNDLSKVKVDKLFN